MPGNGVMEKQGNVDGVAAPAVLGVLGMLVALGALCELGVLGVLGPLGAMGAQRRTPGCPFAEPCPPELRCPRGFLHRERSPRTPTVSLSPTRAVRRPPSRVGDAVPRGMLLGPLRWGPRMRSEHPAPIPLPSLSHPGDKAWGSPQPQDRLAGREGAAAPQLAAPRQRSATAGSRLALAATPTAPLRVFLFFFFSSPLLLFEAAKPGICA